MQEKNNNNKKKKKETDSPLVSHTKAYYGFSKDYPGKADEKGYRDNTKTREKPLDNRARLLVYFAIIFCFILAFIATSVSLQLSNQEPKTAGQPQNLEEFNAEDF